MDVFSSQADQNNPMEGSGEAAAQTHRAELPPSASCHREAPPFPPHGKSWQGDWKQPGRGEPDATEKWTYQKNNPKEQQRGLGLWLCPCWCGRAVSGAQVQRQSAGGVLTILSRGSGIWAALSRSSLYSSSSQSLCSVFSGSFSSTGMATLDRSFPMLFLRMFHTLMLLVLGQGAGKQVLLLDLASPPLLRTGSGREISVVVL